MTFLNPLYLVGALAGVIPLLIHLLHKRRVKVIEFSSLEFLKRIEGRKTRWFRVREVLLLVLRSLSVLLLALAISRPVLRSYRSGSLGAHARTSSVLILDDSYSMGTEEEGSSFERAKERAARVLDLLDRGDEIFVIFCSDVSEEPFQSPVHDRSLVLSTIEGARLKARGTNYKPSLERAMAVLDDSKNLNREVYLFTDMQRSGLEFFSKGGLRGTRNKRLFIFDCGPAGEVRNVAVSDLALLDPLLFEGGRLELAATVENRSPRETRVSLRSSMDGREMGVKEVVVPPYSVKVVELAFSIEGAGLHYVTVSTGEDALSTDNERSVSFRVPGRARVAVVRDGRELGPGYLETALNPEEGLSVFIPTVVSRGSFSSLALADYEVVALEDVSSLSSADVLRIANFVERGGGLFVGLGPSADVQFYNSVFLPRLAAMEIEGPGRKSTGRTYFSRIAEESSNHPIFSPFRDKKRGDMSTIHIYDRVRIKSGGKAVARLSDESPLLVESGLGKGRVLVSAIPFDGSTSDLPLRALYVPLVHRIFRYLSMGEEVRYGVNVGERLSLPLRGAEQVTCIPPDGRPVKMEPRIRSGRTYAEYDLTEVPGVYTMTAGDSAIAHFSVNPAAKESDLSRATEDETRALLAELRPEFLGQAEDPGSSIFSVRLGVELTNPLIALVLVLLVSEMVVAGRWRPPRETEE